MNPILREPAEILLVDDDIVSQAETAEILEAAGHRVLRTRDRQGALRIARQHSLDLIVCDVALPGDSSLELCREIRRLPGMIDVPVMFLSSQQLPDVVRRSHEAGGAYSLRKPLDPEVLTDLVGKALWMPHLVQSRLAMHQPTRKIVPAPQKTLSARVAAIQGIRVPLA